MAAFLNFDQQTIHKFSTGPPNDLSCSHNSIGLVVSDKIFKILANEYTLWTLAAMFLKSAPKTQIW